MCAANHIQGVLSEAINSLTVDTHVPRDRRANYSSLSKFPDTLSTFLKLISRGENEECEGACFIDPYFLSLLATGNAQKVNPDSPVPTDPLVD